MKALEGPHKGRVVAYAPSIFVENAKLVVSESGRQRCLKEKRRNVHAGVVGDVREAYNKIDRLPNTIVSVSLEQFQNLVGFVYDFSMNVTYNPYKYSSFVNIDNQGRARSVHDAEWIIFQERDVKVSKFIKEEHYLHADLV